MERKDEIIWVRRDSVTYKITLADGVHQFCKSFNSDDIKAGYDLEYPKEDNPGFRPNILPCDSQRALFNREVKVLTALGKIEEDLVPRIVCKDSKKMQIFMEYLPFDTYLDLLKTAADEPQKRDSIEAIVNFLAIFHNCCYRNLEKITEDVNRDRKQLRLRSADEEGQRLEKHFLSILGYYKGNLPPGGRAKSSGLPKVAAERAEKDQEHEIRVYLRTKGIDLHALAKDLITQERGITGQEKLFVHGDFRSQNIFYQEDERGNKKAVKICDFDKVRLNCRNEDLVTAMYHLHTYPFDEEREGFLTDLARKYYLNTLEIGSEQELTDRLAGLKASAIRGMVRDFGIHCNLRWKEIEWFISDAEKARYLNLSSQNPKGMLLEDKFIRGLKTFLNYYQSGEGFRQIIEPSSTKKAICQQMKTIERILQEGMAGF